jgi:hypothetical protein
MAKKSKHPSAAVENIRSSGTVGRVRNYGGGPAVRNVDSKVDVLDAETSATRPVAATIEAVKRRHTNLIVGLVVIAAVVAVAIFAPNSLDAVTGFFQAMFWKSGS